MHTSTRSGYAFLLFAASLLMASNADAAAGDATRCNAFRAQAQLPDTTISASRHVPADAARGLPGYCEITGAIVPTAGSRITVVYRLPDTWNNRMLGLGGGGWAGNIQLATAAPALARSYATAQTDGGHPSTNSADVSWVTDNREALIDFSHRAVHLMTTTGKAVITQYYGRAAERHYFQGCSTGGRMGLMEAQRYPDDYDGIIAGAPVYSLLTQTSPVVRDRIFSAPGASITPEQMRRINAAALAACDADDGLVDGIVTDPRQCQWDPAQLRCPEGSSGEHCLTLAQVAAMRQAYTTMRGEDGLVGNYALPRGGELTWQQFVPTTPGPRNPMNGNLQELTVHVFGDAQYKVESFDPLRDQARIHQSWFAGQYEAAETDLAPFLERGGKLILYHGFDDGGPSAYATIDYFEALQQRNGRNADVRLFLAPGVGHCRGGPGANEFDMLTELENWVEKGHAPERIPARNPATGLERPLCPWPTLPYYNGQGDPNGIESFSCMAD